MRQDFLSLLLLSYVTLPVIVRSNFIDSRTHKDYKLRQSDGKRLELVMSDEFETPGRSFAPGEDPVFEALYKPDDTNEAIQFYDHSTEYVTTKEGCLVITTKAVKTPFTVWDESNLKPVTYVKNYTSGMVQTWNKFCFTGGILEMSIDLPGHAESGGIWPAAWLVGNLARATFPKSTMHVWPWSYDKCGDIENLETKQEINHCTDDPGFGLRPNQGRGAPEIDIFEVMPGHNMPGHDKPIEPFFSSSLQISPGIPKHKNRPRNGHRLNLTQTWYNGLYLSKNSDYNYGFWGQECGPEIDNTPNRIHKYMEDAISANTLLNQTHFESQHVYKLEWQPGVHGYLKWYLDSELIFSVEGHSLQELTGSLIPVEPMYLILNTAISHRWGMPEPCPIDKCPVCWRCYDCTNPECQCALPDGMKGCKNLPAEMKIDYIRLYQDREDPLHTIGCSPPGYPTKEFIEAHAERYEDWKGMSDQDLTSYRENLAAVIVSDDLTMSRSRLIWASLQMMLVFLFLILFAFMFQKYPDYLPHVLLFQNHQTRAGYQRIADNERSRENEEEEEERSYRVQA